MSLAYEVSFEEKNPEDYLARKRAREEEEKADRSSRFQRRSVTERLSDSTRGHSRSDNNSPRLRERAPRDRHSYTERNEEISQAVREYRQKRQSLQSVDSSLSASANSSASSSPPLPRTPKRPGRPKRTSSSGSSSGPQASPREEVVVSAGVSKETSLEKSPPSESLVTVSGRSIPEQPTAAKAGLSEAVENSVAKTVTAASSVTSVNSQVEPSSKVVVVDNTESQPTQQNTAAERPQHQRTADVNQYSNSAKPAEPQSSQPQNKQQTNPQRSTSPESAPGAISSARPSSKKTRAPPPPPAASSLKSSSTDTSSSASTTGPQNENSIPSKTAAPASQQGADSGQVSPSDPKPVQVQAEVSRTVPVQSQPPPPQSSSSSSSPTRPARPKRRKDSQNSSGSNASSPRDAPSQPPLREEPAARNTKESEVSLVTEVLGSLPDSFGLSENATVEEEAPPTHGTVTLTSKSTTIVSGKREKSPPTPTAKNAVPPLNLNDTSKASDVSSSNVTLPESVKQKRRKGKAPVPPSSSTSNSSRDLRLSSSSTPSPGSSPRDAPKPAEAQPNTQATKATEIKAEEIKSVKSKAPPPPEQTRSKTAPNPAPETIVQISTKPKESQLELDPVSTKTETITTSVITDFTVPGIKRELSVDRVKEGEKQEKDREAERVDTDRGRISETSSTSAYDSDADSLPPPLPNSAPPPLPSSAPPSQLPNSDLLVEEVIEVRQVAPAFAPPPPTCQQNGKMEEGVLLEFDSMLPDTLPESAEDSQKSMANLRAEFFGLDTSSSKNGKQTLDLLDMDFGSDRKNSQAKNHHENSDDSDISSDERGFEGTFSPGDSGVIMSSLPTSPDESDGRIQLLSYTGQDVPNNNTNGSGSADLITSTTISTTSSKRPQTLSMKKDPGSSGSTLSPTSANSASSPQDMDAAALSPRSKEIFEKARHFAEMVQKPSFVAKREKVDEEEFSQETLQDFEMERRAVISQSTVRRRDVREVLSPQAEEASVRFSDVVEQSPPVQQSATPRQEEPPTPERAESPEAKWEDRPGKVNLYSQNVVQELQSSEEVDRESIANLATTRRQWETIFTSEPKEESSPRSKKSPSKWQVRMPYAEKTSASPSTVTSTAPEPESPPSTETSSMADADTESAIEREIRLAMEREQMLKREQEERTHLAAKQSQQRGFKASSMESSTESELQPTFHELTEADRGSEFLINERVVQQEDAEQEEAMQKGYSLQKLNTVSKGDGEATESIIEREIRLQREREAELAQQRGGRAAPAVSAAPPPQQQRPRTPSPEPVEEVEVVEVEEIPYEEAISRYNHDGESRIAQELRELREREEEIRQLRERVNKTAVSGGGSGDSTPQKPAVSSTPSPSVRQQQPQKSVSMPPTPRSDKSAPTTPRVDKGPSPSVNHSVPRNVHASLHLDADTGPKDSPTPRQETPIEREIRLARERENELRRAKGLPELPPEPKRQESVEQSDKDDFVSPSRYYAPPPDTSMRRFASNRLQQEILVQRNREMTLRQEGKIISTSEEHIQPLRYTEVVGEDRVDGSVKRNFKTPGRRSSATPQEEASKPDSTEASTPRPQGAPSTPRDGAGAKKGTGLSFSYREFAQTAESKIERELREMREREEELRQQRTGGAES